MTTVTETQTQYGQPPIVVGDFTDLDLVEMQFIQYMPIFMPEECALIRMPEQLFALKEFRRMLHAIAEYHGGLPAMREAGLYIYLTTRHGFATPGNPLNRPGWHCDGFGTADINYIWWSRWGTRFAEQPFTDIDPGHVRSMEQFEEQMRPDRIKVYDDRFLLRLNPFVVHTTPEIPEPGGYRQFIKISVSPHKYNLLGNTHNYMFSYDWTMHDRDALRNDPSYGEQDFVLGGAT